MSIRNACKAIIVHNGRILLAKGHNIFGEVLYGIPYGAEIFDLPGGGQEKYESLEDAVIRECMEETGYNVQVERLGAVCEEISTDEQMQTERPTVSHKVVFIFICHIDNFNQAAQSEEDIGTIEPCWIDINDIPSTNLLPPIVKDNIVKIINSKETLYLGAQFYNKALNFVLRQNNL